MQSRTAPIHRWVIPAIVCAGVLGRIVVLVAAINGPYDPYNRLGADMAKYIGSAVSLSRGEGFSLHYRPVLSDLLRGAPALPGAPTPTSQIAPGYPVFLAGAFAVFGYELYTVIALQALLSALTGVFIYLTAKEVGGAAVWALAFGLLYYPFALDAIYVLAESVLTFCTAASLWLLVKARTSLVAGLVAGFTVLVRSVAFPFFVLAPLFTDRRRAWVFWLGLGLVLFPWGLRNYLHTGTPYLTPSYSGRQLLVLHNPGNRDFPLFARPGDLNEDFRGWVDAAHDAERRVPPIANAVAREYRVDREHRRQAVQFILAEPWQFVRAVGYSLMNTWRVDYPTANWVRWLTNVVLYLGLLPFVVVGSIRAWRYGPPGARLLVVFLVYFVVIHSFMASEIRYRISAMPAYFVLASLGLPHAARRLDSVPS